GTACACSSREIACRFMRWVVSPAPISLPQSLAERMAWHCGARPGDRTPAPGARRGARGLRQHAPRTPFGLIRIRMFLPYVAHERHVRIGLVEAWSALLSVV